MLSLATMIVNIVLKITMMLFLFHNQIIFGSTIDYNPINTPKTLAVSPQIILPIGIKIWFNESGGNVEGLTSWNDGENFASLGIGHFIWHPYSNAKNASFKSGFPHLVRYIEKRGINIPTWLRGNGTLYCPWNNRQEFLQAQQLPRMVELRIFLRQTISIQAEYMVQHLETILPDLLASAQPEDRLFIYNQFHTLSRTSTGIYALVDYLNFKGAGLSNSKDNYENGSGLLHVLKGMKFAQPGLTPLQAYVWSAKNALIRRVENSPSSSHQERWLGGWFNRLNTYLEGEYYSYIQSSIR